MKENEFRLDTIRLDTTQRPDVVLKTILRSIRRYFITIFNNTTNYNKCKRGKGPGYFWEQLYKFTTHLFTKPEDPSFTHIEVPENNEMTEIFLGSIFYPNDMTATLKDRKASSETLAQVELVHRTLYSFSNNNLHKLLRSNSGCR